VEESGKGKAANIFTDPKRVGHRKCSPGGTAVPTVVLSLSRFALLTKSALQFNLDTRPFCLSIPLFLNIPISMVRKVVRQFAFVLAAIGLVTSQQTFAESPIGVYQGPTGVYRGGWRSSSNGHHGPMRAVLKQKSDGTVQARFTGRFALVIPFAYKVTLQPIQDGFGNTILTANKPLGPILGSYQMTAQANALGLNGNFQAAGDSGSIQMNRVR